MERLISLLGAESGLDEVSRALRRHVERDRPPVVGAMQITCADAAERECIDAFQKEFVNRLLPELKFWSKAPFRSGTPPMLCQLTNPRWSACSTNFTALLRVDCDETSCSSAIRQSLPERSYLAAKRSNRETAAPSDVVPWI